MDRDPRFLSRRLGLRTTVGELILVAVVLGLGVNLLSTTLGDLLSNTLVAAIGAGMTLGACGFLAFAYFRRREFRHKIRAVVFRDPSSGKVLQAQEYNYSYYCEQLLRAAFAENPALERQWTGLSKADVSNSRQTPHRNDESESILAELTEYIVLEKIDVFLTDHFDQRGEADKRRKLENYGRNDVPDLLLTNRFFELFSRNMRDRVGFEQFTDEESDGVVYMAFGDNAYFNRFELTLPRGSKVGRTDGWITISAPRTSIRFRVTYGYSTVTSWGFEKHWMGRSITNTDAIEYIVEVAVSVRPRVAFRSDAVADGVWAQELTNALYEELDFDHFLEEMRWPSVGAILSRVQSRTGRETPEGEPSAGSGTEASDSIKNSGAAP